MTLGVYCAFGFEVTPSTVIGLLTILGYSLYDTVVVFDKVRENTDELTKQSAYTFAESTNTRGQSDAHPLDQYVGHQHPAGGFDSIRRRFASGSRYAEGFGPRDVYWANPVHHFVDLHRLAHRGGSC